MLKVANKVSIYRVESLNDVEQTQITSASFTHVSENEMLCSSIYEPNDMMTTYQTYGDTFGTIGRDTTVAFSGRSRRSREGWANSYFIWKVIFHIRYAITPHDQQ